jgi:proteasome activator subunit 4
MEALIEAAAAAGVDISKITFQDDDPSQTLNIMDDDDDVMSTLSGDSTEQSEFDRQRASLQTYLDSLPYDCESPEEMQESLEDIVQKIYICAKSKNWLVLTTWDGMLQWCDLPRLAFAFAYFVCSWLLMRYPMAKSTRAKLVRMYYELCLAPGIEPRVIRSWADMVSRLLSNKPGLKRKLESTDLELPWQPLWRVLQKELWPKKRIQDSS